MYSSPNRSTLSLLYCFKCVTKYSTAHLLMLMIIKREKNKPWQENAGCPNKHWN